MRAALRLYRGATGSQYCPGEHWGLQLLGRSAAACPAAAACLHPPPESQAGRRDGEHHVLERESWVSTAGSAPVGHLMFAGCKAQESS